MFRVRWQRRALLPLSLVVGVAGGLTLARNGAVARDPVGLHEDALSTAATLEAAFVRVAEAAGPATVSITAELEPVRRSGVPITPPGEDELFSRAMPAPTSLGSGVVVRGDGYILTNDHVVAGAKENRVRVTLADGSSLMGEVFRDPISDLALVRVRPTKPLPFVAFADSETLRVGQSAIAIGSPFGQQNSMTTGIVSALHRKSQIGSGANRRYYPALIQTDAAINRGNSGGPLLNLRGELIGINVAIWSPTGASSGIGFAIPANTARRVMEQLVASGKVTRGYLGLMPIDIPIELRPTLGERGALVERVDDGTPAATAGVEPGDVILTVAGKAVDGEVALRDTLASTAPGTKVAIALLRDGKAKTVQATLGALPSAVPTLAAERPTPSAVVPVVRRFGLTVESADAETRKELGLGEKPALLVTRVLPGSPADDTELSMGCAIVSVGGKPVGTEASLTEALSALKPGDGILVRYVARTREGNLVRGAAALVAR